MKTINKILVVVFTGLLMLSCEAKDYNAPDTWPEWPALSVPTIENAVLTGLTGQTEITAGDLVKFTAHISDEANDLVSYELKILFGDKVLVQKEEQISGRSFDIDIQTKIPLSPGLQNGERPVITIKVVNALASSFTEITLDDEHNVIVNRPVIDKLYIVDDLGNVFELNKVGTSELFQTSDDLTGLGNSFKIAEKIKNENQIDYAGLVWGVKDNQVLVIESDSDPSITVGVPANNSVQSISFNISTFVVGKTLALLDEIGQLYPAGRWLFDNPSNLMEALVSGQDLIRVSGNAEGLNAVTGPSLYNGAAEFTEFYKFPHGIAANGGGNRVNEYTLVMDMRTHANVWYSFLKANDNVDNLGIKDVLWIDDSGHLGFEGGHYEWSDKPLITPNVWHRFVIQVRVGSVLKFYLNGVLINDGSADDSGKSIDYLMSLSPNGFCLGPSDPKTGEISFAQVAIFDRMLSDAEVQSLGGVQ